MVDEINANYVKILENVAYVYVLFWLLATHNTHTTWNVVETFLNCFTFPKLF